MDSASPDAHAEDGPARAPRNRAKGEPDEVPDPGAAPELFEPFAELLGAVLMVPNTHWGFENVRSEDHPGACTDVAATQTGGILVKGTDANNVRYPAGHFFVHPEPETGLTKPTAFELVPRRFRMRRLKLYVPERRIGRLSGGTLQALRAELARLHPED